MGRYDGTFDDTGLGDLGSLLAGGGMGEILARASAAQFANNVQMWVTRTCVVRFCPSFNHLIVEVNSDDEDRRVAHLDVTSLLLDEFEAKVLPLIEEHQRVCSNHQSAKQATLRRSRLAAARTMRAVSHDGADASQALDDFLGSSLEEVDALHGDALASINESHARTVEMLEDFVTAHDGSFESVPEGGEAARHGGLVDLEALLMRGPGAGMPGVIRVVPFGDGLAGMGDFPSAYSGDGDGPDAA